MREEPGAVLAAIFGAEGVPIGATGTLQALSGEPGRDQGLTHWTSTCPLRGSPQGLVERGAEIPGTQRMPNDGQGAFSVLTSREGRAIPTTE